MKMNIQYIPEVLLLPVFYSSLYVFFYREIIYSRTFPDASILIFIVFYFHSKQPYPPQNQAFKFNKNQNNQ